MWSSLTGTQHVHRDYSRSSGFLGQKHGAHASWGHIASPEQRAGVRASLGRIQSRSSVQVGGPPSHHPHPHSVQEPGTPAGRIQWVALVVNQAAGKIKKTDADESLHVCLTDSGTPHQHIFFFWEYSDDYIQLTSCLLSPQRLPDETPARPSKRWNNNEAVLWTDCPGTFTTLVHL